MHDCRLNKDKKIKDRNKDKQCPSRKCSRDPKEHVATYNQNHAASKSNGAINGKDSLVLTVTIVGQIVTVPSSSKSSYKTGRLHLG